MKEGLQQQLVVQMATMLADNEKELKADKEYFDEFRDIELKKDFIHTSGNMGKIGT